MPVTYFDKLFMCSVPLNVYVHTKVSTWVQGSPHLGQRSWFPPFPDPPDPDILFPSAMLFCVNTTVS